MDLNWFKRFVIEGHTFIQEWINLMNQQFKTVPINCTGLVRFAVSHIRVKTLKMILSFILWKIVRTDTYFHFELNIIFHFTLFLESIWYCMVISVVFSFMVFFKITKHAHFPNTKLRVCSSCCSRLRRRWTWFLRIIK